MKAERAREIMESTGVIDVHYQGLPVWLEGLQGEQVTISFMDNTQRKMQVDLTDLVEQ